MVRCRLSNLALPTKGVDVFVTEMGGLDLAALIGGKYGLPRSLLNL